MDLTRRVCLTHGAAYTALGSCAGQVLAASGSHAKFLQIVGPWEVGRLEPAATGSLFQRLQVAETLLGADDLGQAVPELAVRWSLSDDQRVWRFELRQQARFHDGTAVTAQAVAQSMRWLMKPPGMLVQAQVSRMQAIGTHVLEIQTAQPFAKLPALLAHSSCIVLAPSCFDAQGRVSHVLGSGPYQITRLRPPQSIHTRRFPQYDGPSPAIEQVRYLAVGRAETRALMAEGGQADMAFQLDPVSWSRLKLRPYLRIEQITLPRSIAIKVNAGMPALSDVRVRQALSLCIDRQGIAKALLRDASLAATQLLSPAALGWHSAQLAPLQHQPALAAQLLQQAGWQRHAEGWRNANGQALSLQLRTFPDRPELPIIATALQAQWRQAGVAVKVSIGNSGDIPLGHRDGSLQLALMARNYGNVADVGVTLLQDFGPNGGDWGAMRWSAPGVAQALQSLARQKHSAVATQRLRQTVVQLLQDELPVIPVTWYKLQVAVNQRLQGVSLDPLERSYRISRMSWRA
jgi:peptide/nickel transport system substrate-binding protein